MYLEFNLLSKQRRYPYWFRSPGTHPAHHCVEPPALPTSDMKHLIDHHLENHCHLSPKYSCLPPAHQVSNRAQCFPHWWCVYEASRTVELHGNISCVDLIWNQWFTFTCGRGFPGGRQALHWSHFLLLSSDGHSTCLLMQARTSGEHRLQSRASPAVKGDQG